MLAVILCLNRFFFFLILLWACHRGVVEWHFLPRHKRKVNSSGHISVFWIAVMLWVCCYKQVNVLWVQAGNTMVSCLFKMLSARGPKLVWLFKSNNMKAVFYLFSYCTSAFCKTKIWQLKTAFYALVLSCLECWLIGCL